MGEKKFKPFPILKTERLILRKLASDDANEIFALRSSDLVNKYLDRKPSNSIDNAKNFIQAINKNIESNDSFYWAITLNDSDKLIGTICLFDFSNDNRKAEIGYELLPNFQKNGIMQEAISAIINYGVNQIGLKTIEACTHSENEHSIQLLIKFNFKKKSSSNGNFIMFQLNSQV